ncbi:MAG: general secretion pathway protein GspK [Myxococcaceae bacterium]
MALLIVVVSIAILATVAAEFAYSSRVDLELATHERDALRAEYLARSGLGMARLLLQFQKQLDVSMQTLTSSIPGLAGSSFNLQLWRMAHVDCQTLGRFLPDGADAGFGAPKKKSADPRPGDGQMSGLGTPFIDYGSFRGCYGSIIEDEEAKLNVNQLDSLLTAGAGGAAVQRLYLLLTDKRFEFVFDKEDANNVKITATDALINIKDWADSDDLVSALAVSATGAQVSAGFADEPGLYSKYLPRYRPKNASMDSLDELYFVHGIGDRFMAAFGDRLTVYPDVNALLNVNTDDPIVLALAIRTAADPAKPDGRLADPVFLDSLVQKIAAARMLSPMGMTVSDFINVLVQAGVAVNPQITSNLQGNSFLGDHTKTFRVTATGEVGDVQRTVTAVVRITQPQDGLGRLLYWKVD